MYWLELLLMPYIPFSGILPDILFNKFLEVLYMTMLFSVDDLRKT